VLPALTRPIRTVLNGPISPVQFASAKLLTGCWRAEPVGRYTFRMPDIGEGIAEAEIVAWHVKLGDRVEEDARLADVMTDKATVELECPATGVVVELAGVAGDKVAIRAPLVVLEIDGEGDAEENSSSSFDKIRTSTEKAGAGHRDRVDEVKFADSEPVAASFTTAMFGNKVLASAAVRARGRNLGIDLAQVQPGAEGRIHHADLDAYISPLAPTLAAVDKAEQKPVEILSGAGEQIKVIGLRRRIAEAMSASKRHIPHFSYVDECDVTACEALRAELNALGRDGPKLTILPLLIRAICVALPDFPMINARFDDLAGVVTRYDAVHLGIAVQTEGGLKVPVIRDAQALGLWQLAAEIARLAAAARDGSALAQELSGSTLTVTSLGALGGVATTPVINRPEVAIIGPNRIIERPMFISDGSKETGVSERIEKRKIMNISISCDHRVIDGWDAANFVQAVKHGLERPMLLLSS
jgi:2-oxoisovalerate dehydrogenase E2 component (dihydrolipoyl transacylase)